MLALFRRVFRAAIIESGRADHPQRNLPAHNLDAADQIVAVAQMVDGHKIGNFRHAVVGQETRQQHVRVRKIKLLVPETVRLRRTDLEAPSFFRIQQGRKNGR